MRQFKYLGPTTEQYKKDQLVPYDGASAAPDGGVLQEYWLEVEDQPVIGAKELSHGNDTDQPSER